MTERVYIVASGDYSDYGIRFVFATREDADRYCAEHDAPHEAPFVEEWKVLGPGVQPVTVSIHNRRTWIDSQGEIHGTGHVWTKTEELHPDDKPSARYIESRGHERWKPGAGAEIETNGANFDRVLKVHTDAVAKMRAQIMGLL